MNEEKKQKEYWDNLKGFAIWLGTYGWIILLFGGILFILWGFIGLLYPAVAEATIEQVPVLYANLVIDIAGILHIHGLFTYIMWFVGGILAIIFTFAFVKPRFSNRWKETDYDYLLNDVIKIGRLRIPLMLIVGIILEILMSWWGGLIIIIPLLLLVFIGPKKYKWKEN
ncbi:MAG: hypothetical protein ACFE8A_02515 [Candidatus Hodarchaeota archaeon]